MKNSLKTLQRIQKFSIDEQRKILNDYLEAEEKLHHRLQKLNQEFENEKVYNSIVRKIPMRRLGSVEDVIGSVIFLASDASNYVTGAVIAADGGWLCE